MPSSEHEILIEPLARRIHERYCERNAGNESARPWDDELPAALKAQNFDQARDLLAKVASIGLHVVKRSDATAADIVEELDSADVLRLAIAEHDRWARMKVAQGYRYGPAVVNDGPDKRHPNLVDWDDLDEADRRKDMQPVADIPELLGELDLVLVPQ